LLLSLLLLVTSVWGGCISCEQYFMFGQSRGCCNPDGHCKPKVPRKNSQVDCKQIAFDHQKGIDLHFDLPVAAVRRLTVSVRHTGFLSPRRDALPIDPSPPDLQALHSTFLI